MWAACEGHVDGVEYEGHVQLGVGRTAVGREANVVADDVGRREGGRQGKGGWQARALCMRLATGGLLGAPRVADEAAG